jgi:hypothetical protein
MIFILDDDNCRIDEIKKTFSDQKFMIAQSFIDAKPILLNNSFDVLFLDNDLGTGYGTGTDVAKFIVDNNLHKSATIYIHSMNNVASKDMAIILKDYPNVMRVPYSILLNQLKMIQKTIRK